jgi:hypothetical protein
MHPLVGLQLSGDTLTPLDELGPGEGHLGRPVWNARQLLSDLELRLGLPRPELGRGLRVQRWSQRLAALVTDCSRAAPYFAAAYAADPTGTAAQLLRLRDELIDAGWDGESLLGAERLETLHRLSALDGPPLPPGLADQLSAVEVELAQATRSPYTALGLVDDLDLWPGRWRRVLQRLQTLGTRVEHVRPSWPSPSGSSDLARFQRALLEGRVRELSPPAGDGSLVLLRAATSSLLAEPTAALLSADRALSTVVIRGLDPGPLDAALHRQGLPRQGVVSSSRWRPALQVLRLALTVAFVPKDPRRLLELVTLTGGPFAGRAGRRLAAKYALEWKGRWKVTSENSCLEIKGSGLSHGALSEQLEPLRTPGFWSEPETRQKILALVPEYRLSKFQRVLPDALQVEMVGDYLVDFAATGAFLAATDMA